MKSVVLLTSFIASIAFTPAKADEFRLGTKDAPSGVKFAQEQLSFSEAFALGMSEGGAVVAGGKTHWAILIYPDELEAKDFKAVKAVIAEQLEMDTISEYGRVKDQMGIHAICVEFRTVQTQQQVESVLFSILGPLSQPSAIQGAGNCSFPFGVIN